MSITILKEDINDALIDHIFQMDSLGQITLDDKYQRLHGESWADAFERLGTYTHEHLSTNTADAFGLSGKLQEAEILVLGGTSELDDTQLADELSSFNTEVRVWFESCDGFNASELIVFSDGDHILYDVDYDDSVPIIRADALNLIRNYPAPEFKTVVLDLLQSTRFNDKANYPKPFDAVIQRHKVATVLGRLDEGEIESAEAMDLIKEINKPVMNEYMVLVDSDYCDGQAILTKTEGEFGGDGHVELSRTYPICVGTYRGESPEQAIKQAAESMEADEEIFTAVPIQK